MIKPNKTLILAILSIAMVGDLNTFVAPALAVIAQAFPAASPTAIQMIMTAAMVGQFPMTFAAGFMATRIRIKKLLLFGLICIMAGGFLPLILHGSIAYLYIGAGLMGVGQGTCLTLMITLINTLFTGDLRSQLLGWQNSVVMCSMMIIMSVSGLLASIAWYNVYYLSFLGVPVFFLVAFLLPMDEDPRLLRQQKAQEEGSLKAKGVFPPSIIVLAVFVGLFAVGFATIILNTAMVIADRSIGGGEPWVAGLMSSFSYFISIIAGLVYKYVLRVVKQMILFTGAVSMTLGLFVVYNAYIIPMYMLGETLIYAGFVLAFTGGMEAIGRIVKPEWVSSCTGVYFGLNAFGAMIAPYVINKIAETATGEVSPGNALLVGSIWIACTSVLGLIWGIRNRQSFADLRKDPVAAS